MQTIKNIIETSGSIKITAEDLKEITPAQCFIDDVAVVSVFFPELIQVKEAVNHERVWYLITSDKRKIPLKTDDLIKAGYYTHRWPNHETRWSIPSIKKFLAGQAEVNIQKTFQQIKDFYKHYVDLESEVWNEVMACWVIGTYFHRMFNSFPYIHLNGDQESGKSKTGFLTIAMAFNGEPSVNSSAPFIVRMVHDNNASCFIDEVENLSKNEDNATLISTYNAGYKKGATTGKCERTGKDRWTIKRFDAYSPKIFGGIKRLYTTLASRVIPITMVRSVSREIKNSDFQESDPKFQDIRDQLYVYMMIAFKEVQTLYQSSEDTDLQGREWELWKPILTIAKAIDSELHQRIRELALTVQKQKRELLVEDSLTPKILEILLAFVQNDGDKKFYTLTQIADALTGFNYNPYHDEFIWLDDGKNHSRWIGDELRKAGIVKGSSQQGKVDGTNSRGFVLDSEIIKKRLEAYGQTSVTPLPSYPSDKEQSK